MEWNRSYLRSFSNGSPSLNDLAVDEVVTWDIHNPDNFCVGVVLVPDVEDEAVRLVTDLDLEGLAPLRIEAVVDHPGLGDPAFAELNIHEGV